MKQKLQRRVHQLHRIYTKHLLIWIYALTHADHLRPNITSVTMSSKWYSHTTQQQQRVSKASQTTFVPATPHVRMSTKEIQQQHEMIEQLMELQKEVETVFRMSQQLGISSTIQ
jgi:TolA-binding protein